MKYTSLRHRVAALEARLNLRRSVIRIEGGLPPNFKPPAAEPPGADLKRQAAAFKRPRPSLPQPRARPDGAKSPQRQTAASGHPERS